MCIRDSLKLARRMESKGGLLQMYQIELDFTEDGENNQLNFYVHPAPCDRETFVAVMEEREANDFAEACTLSFQSDTDEDEPQATKAKPPRKSRAPSRKPAKAAEQDEETPAGDESGGDGEPAEDGIQSGGETETPSSTRRKKPAASVAPKSRKKKVAAKPAPEETEEEEETEEQDELDAETLALLGDADELDLD